MLQTKNGLNFQLFDLKISKLLRNAGKLSVYSKNGYHINTIQDMLVTITILNFKLS